jgi:hypothetical protein
MADFTPFDLKKQSVDLSSFTLPDAHRLDYIAFLFN